MRRVMLDGRNGPHPDGGRRDKLAGHLHARLMEYADEGISASVDGPGTVSARFDGTDGTDAVRRLADAGVFARAEGERVRFLMGPDTAFEDLDYVQAAAAGLL